LALSAFTLLRVTGVGGSVELFLTLCRGSMRALGDPTLSRADQRRELPKPILSDRIVGLREAPVSDVAIDRNETAALMCRYLPGS
jgi:hypothetical protein